MKYISLAICICAFLAASITYGYLMDAPLTAITCTVIAIFLAAGLLTLATRETEDG